ncbi:MAG: hypothetical protein ACI4LB_01795 [Candidatus Fimenecus sp.]
MNELLKLFLYIIGTGLPCYLFFILMYIILKKISPNGDISKRFYNNISDKDEPKYLNVIDSFMSWMYPNIMLYMVGIVLAFTIIIIIIDMQNVPVMVYILSDAALRFQKYFIETVLTIILASVGSIAIFSSLNKDYYVFFTSKDIIEIFKVKNNILSIFIYYISCTFSTMVYYFCHYVIDDEKKLGLGKLFSFATFAVFAVFTLFYIGRLLRSILTFLLSDDAEHRVLSLLYKKIHTKRIPGLHIQEASHMDNSLHHLLSNLNISKMNDVKISFVSFINEYSNFPKNLKIKNMCITTAVCTIFNLLFAMIIRTLLLQKGLDFIGIGLGREISLSIAFSILLNAVTCCFLYKTPLNQILIHLNMWAWGFRIEDGDETYYSSTSHNHITKKKYNNYFIKLYNILSAFKDILSTNEKNAIYCLQKIIEGINYGYGDYLLYIVSLFLYSEKYKLNRKELSALKQYIENNNIDWQVVRHNTIAIIEDIERKNLESEVNAFIDRIKNSNLRTKVKKCKK